VPDLEHRGHEIEARSAASALMRSRCLSIRVHQREVAEVRILEETVLNPSFADGP